MARRLVTGAFAAALLAGTAAMAIAQTSSTVGTGGSSAGKDSTGSSVGTGASSAGSSGMNKDDEKPGMGLGRDRERGKSDMAPGQQRREGGDRDRR